MVGFEYDSKPAPVMHSWQSDRHFLATAQVVSASQRTLGWPWPKITRVPCPAAALAASLNDSARSGARQNHQPEPFSEAVRCERNGTHAQRASRRPR
jgi:hypothetical protein